MLGTGSGGVVRAGYVLTSWVYRANELRACLCLHSRHFAHRTALSATANALLCVFIYANAISRIGSRERNEALRGACILLHYHSLRDHDSMRRAVRTHPATAATPIPVIHVDGHPRARQEHLHRRRRSKPSPQERYYEYHGTSTDTSLHHRRMCTEGLSPRLSPVAESACKGTLSLRVSYHLDAEHPLALAPGSDSGRPSHSHFDARMTGRRMPKAPHSDPGSARLRHSAAISPRRPVTLRAPDGPTLPSLRQ